MLNSTKEILSCSDLRNSIVGIEFYELDLIDDGDCHLSSKLSVIPAKECWDVVKAEFHSMIRSGIEYISDSHIKSWLSMTHEFGYSFYYQHQLINGKSVVKFIAGYNGILY